MNSFANFTIEYFVKQRIWLNVRMKVDYKIMLSIVGQFNRVGRWDMNPNGSFDLCHILFFIPSESSVYMTQQLAFSWTGHINNVSETDTEHSVDVILSRFFFVDEEYQHDCSSVL